MFLTTLASLGLALTSLTTASPLQKRQSPVPDRFYLRTEVYGGIKDSGSRKEGLYVFSYHTGAGLGVAAAEPPDQEKSWFYLNNTDTGLYFTYTDNKIGPWPTTLLEGPYQGMSSISASIAAWLILYLQPLTQSPSPSQMVQPHQGSSSMRQAYNRSSRKEAGLRVTGGYKIRKSSL